jgi:hypothetical protein
VDQSIAQALGVHDCCNDLAEAMKALDGKKLGVHDCHAAIERRKKMCANG